MLFDRFTEKAQEAIALAQESLSRFKHQELRPEHIFYGLLVQTDGVVPQILRKLEVKPEEVQRAVEQALRDVPQIYSETASGGQIYLARQAQKVLDKASVYSMRISGRRRGKKLKLCSTLVL